MSLTIVPGTPDRLPDMARLMSEALLRDVPLARLQRKYLIGGDAGPGYSSFLMDGDRPVGVGGCIPYRYILPNGRRVIAAQYCDFGLLPAYRGTGVFRNLCLHLHQTSRDRGAAFSFALTSEGSRAALMRALDHRESHDLHSFDVSLSSDTGFVARGLDRLRRSVGWRGVTGDRAPAARTNMGLGHAERAGDFVRIRQATGALFPEIMGQPVMIRPGGVMNVALPGDIAPEDVGPVLDELCHKARRAGTRVLRLLLAEDDPAYDHVNRIAGPSPGFLRACVAALDPDLDPLSLRFGFADYENF